ncbi:MULTISPECIES: (2Fe-2S)-binding protein [Clostridium]|uniref:BFD-like [2Fe-2S] binding domain-containing protein n=1 Tax=Clostridium cadaveris TaxID=1529 RepID=A0A1I2MJR1_9CLOT|nr:(2Fe-2S)-binding protein [Clostridium cadaveris]MDU4951879.1 (2Fe-2S)-binding protein [Clostridium sp.]MDM8311275.1 (2Fe-2S)-binding protein [Clostridium cadaveris]NME64257.1 (2Fe-2S)-binding protein [Clostridium cadaveris]NWK11028.1 (2Fe-2S)-binding protein [Clostridium cadaveris]UFH65939.1 (2Fe-2S)-binding protein [Clostridium cadaveris]
MSNDKIICICNQVDEDTIINAIKEGATTVDAVREKTGATGGACHGARCKKKVEALIEKYK